MLKRDYSFLLSNSTLHLPYKIDRKIILVLIRQLKNCRFVYLETLPIYGGFCKNRKEK